MKRSVLHTAIHILTTLSLLLLGACTEGELTDPKIDEGASINTDGKILVTLPLSIGQIQLPATRVTDIESTLDLSKAIILIFKTENGVETYYEKIEDGKFILKYDTKNIPILSLKMQPSVGIETYRIVMMLNYGQLTISSPLLTVGETMEQTLSKYSVSIGNGGWNNSRSIPLCGKTDSRTVKEGVVFKDEDGTSDKIQLIRSLARIDVGVNFTEPDNINNNSTIGLTNFRLNSAILAGFPAQTFIARWTEVDTPSVTSNMMHWDASSYYLYKATWDQATSPNAVQGYFYMGEMAAETSISDKSNCLIVGGYYGGSTTETFYRIDLASSDGKPFAKLRNHLYRVNIKEVRGSGLSTAAEAVANKGMTTNDYLNAAIVGWDQGSAAVAEVGNKYLSINLTNHTVGKTAATHNNSWLKIQTNCSLINSTSSDESWLTPKNDKGEVAFNGTFTVTENTTGKARIAQLTIRTDVGLKLTINITQTP